MSAFGVHVIVSVVATPVAVVVTTVAHDPEVIAEVPRAEVPEAMVRVIEVSTFAAGRTPVTASVSARSTAPNPIVGPEPTRRTCPTVDDVVARTNPPAVPVSSVRAEARLADEGVAAQVATPEPKPEIPVAIGRPVALVRVAAEGVPRSGVLSNEVVTTPALLEAITTPDAAALGRFMIYEVTDVGA
jgi:hypothetical protein